MTIWLTADLHIGHFNIIGYCDRPFGDLESMHETMIRKWNQLVEDQDEVHILGDLGFVKGSGDQISDFLDRTIGKKVLVRGNHDKGERTWYLENGIAEVHDRYEVLSGCLLSHYPLEPDIYDGKKVRSTKEVLRNVYAENRCGFHYYGHTHKPPVKGDNFMNVGVDLHDFHPIRFRTHDR